MIGLSFDLGRHSGWCCGELERKTPLFGHFVIEGTTWGDQSVSLADEVGILMNRFHPAVISYEAPLVIHAGAAQVLAGYAFMVEFLAKIGNVACTPVANSAAKRFFTGRMYGKKTIPYPGIVEAHRRGFAVTTTDEADAVAIWHLTKQWLTEGRICVDA